MSDKEVVETVYGKHHKFEILKERPGVFSSTKFYVHMDGKPFKGPFDSLAVAVQKAKDAG